jgi:hypothetical protein
VTRPAPGAGNSCCNSQSKATIAARRCKSAPGGAFLGHQACVSTPRPPARNQTESVHDRGVGASRHSRCQESTTRRQAAAGEGKHSHQSHQLTLPFPAWRTGSRTGTVVGQGGQWDWWCGKQREEESKVKTSKTFTPIVTCLRAKRRRGTEVAGTRAHRSQCRTWRRSGTETDRASTHHRRSRLRVGGGPEAGGPREHCRPPETYRRSWSLVSGPGHHHRKRTHRSPVGQRQPRCHASGYRLAHKQRRVTSCRQAGDAAHCARAGQKRASAHIAVGDRTPPPHPRRARRAIGRRRRGPTPELRAQVITPRKEQ